MMIRRSILSGISIAIAFMFLMGCQKEPEVIFDIPVRLEFEIPAGLNPFDKHFFLLRDVPTNLSSLKAQFGVADDQPLLIRPAQAIFSTKLQNLDLNFIDEIEVSIFESDPDIDRIAFLTDQVPFNAGRSIIIVPFDLDFAEDFALGRVNYKVSFRLRSTTPSFIDGILDLTFGAE